MSPRKFKGGPKTGAQRVEVPKGRDTTNWYANVDGELRFSTTKGHKGISEWKRPNWHTHVADCHLFSWAQFRQWVVEYVEAEEREAVGACGRIDSAEGEVSGGATATAVGERYENRFQDQEQHP